MSGLHIIQGGISNNDKAWLERAAVEHLDAPTWTAPKVAEIGDDAVIYVGGYGFFATATIKSAPKPHKRRKNRYRAALTAIRLIEPAINLYTIKKHVRGLTWAEYPRSYTTPSPDVAAAIRELIHNRRKTGIPDLDEKSLREANIDELRKVAILAARTAVPAKERTTLYRAGSQAIKLYVLHRASGLCEGCGESAPFCKSDRTPYLEPHHTSRLADEGPDHPAHVIALCPNCHRRAHHAEDAKAFNASLIKTLLRLEGKTRA